MKKHLLIALIILLLPNIAQAQEPNFGISVDCFKGCRDKEMDYSQDILLEVTITNNLGYWISLDEERRGQQYSGSGLRLTVESSNLKDGKESVLFQGILGGGFFLKPKDTLKLYLQLYPYNKMDKDIRLGEWRITPEFSPTRIKYYSSEFSKEEITFRYGAEPIKTQLKETY